MKAQLDGEFASSPMARTLAFAQVLPEPPGMDAYRAEQAREAAARQAEREQRLDLRPN